MQKGALRWTARWIFQWSWTLKTFIFIVKYTLHNIYHFNHSQIQLHCCATITTICLQNFFTIPRWNSIPIKEQHPIPRPPAPVTTILLSVSINLTTPGTSYMSVDFQYEVDWLWPWDQTPCVSHFFSFGVSLLMSTCVMTGPSQQWCLEDCSHGFFSDFLSSPWETALQLMSQCQITVSSVIGAANFRVNFPCPPQ